MSFRDALIQINTTFWDARAEPFGGHTVASFIRNDVPQMITQTVPLLGTEMVAEASAGKGRWASSPWIRVTDRSISDSAERGYYPVYLFALDQTHLVLTLLQGTISVRQEFGQRRKSVLRSRASIIAAKVPEHSPNFTAGVFSLYVTGNVPDRDDWEVAGAFSKTYDLNALPSNSELLNDLREMIDLYRKAIYRGGWEDLDDQEDHDAPAVPGQVGIDGRRRLKRHMALERNRTLAKEAKRIHGMTCKACGSTMEHLYGDAGREYIEAHHLVPLAQVATLGGVLRDPNTDFTVLCPNCHRMIHKLGAIPLADFIEHVKCRAAELCASANNHP